MEEWMWAIWLGILIIAIIVEFLTEELISVWFIGGAALALILSSFAYEAIPWWAELIVFVGVSLLLLLIVRPLAKEYLTKDQVDSNADTMVGKLGILTKDVTELDYGEVKISGNLWRAVLPAGEKEIKEGTKVKVIAIEGNKLIVKPLREEK